MLLAVADGDRTWIPPEHAETVDVLGPKARAARPPHEHVPETQDVPLEIGRYRLLQLVGTGGMGMVWGAWDPELERRVALKLVRVTSADARERIQREGQALARLSHPNVVPIYDVGVVGEQVYLVMEWVHGTTLRELGEPPAAIVEAYRQAGAGLAAAHEAGIIHRDFKPDNAIRGEDGRVRVLDFGLAAPIVPTGSQRAAGTPRYMAPEQVKAEELTFAVDQYAFGVSLREALGDAMPSWIAPIVARATAEDPHARFSSMAELLAALAHDPARRRRRAAVGVAILVLAGGAFAIGKTRSAAVETCVGGTEEIASVWNANTRNAVLGAAGDRVVADLDRYAADWAAEHRRTCVAAERKELPPARHEARLACLDRARAQLAAAGDVLATAPRSHLDGALLAARSLPDVRACAESDQVMPPSVGAAPLVREAAPRVERALVLAIARRADAIADATAAATTARATGYAPLIARALLAEGRAALVAGRPDAEALFAEAMKTALAAFDDVLAVEAYARLVFVRAITQRPVSDDDAMISIAERLGDRGRFARALLDNNRGVARLVANDHDGARALFERTRAIAGERPELELLASVRNLANLADTPEAGEQLARFVLARHEAALGADHPETYMARFQVGLMIRESGRARAEIEAACEGLIRWEQRPLIADCAYEAAWLADQGGDEARAARWMERVQDGDRLRARVAAAYLDPRRRAALEALPDQIASWELVEASDALVLAARATSDRARRHVLLVRAAELLERLDLMGYRRRLAVLERALAEDEPARYAARALAWYRGVPGEEAIVARLEHLATPASAPSSR